MNKPREILSMLALAILSLIATLVLSGVVVFTLAGFGSAEEAVLDTLAGTRDAIDNLSSFTGTRGGVAGLSSNASIDAGARSATRTRMQALSNPIE